MCSRRRVVAERLAHSTPALVMNVYGHVNDGCRSKRRRRSNAFLESEAAQIADPVGEYIWGDE
jgi:hypothetical protein